MGCSVVWLSPERFNRHLNKMGQQFEWKRAYACPCVNANSGAADTRCLHCFGKGKIWDDIPVIGQAGIVGNENLRKFGEFGRFDASDTMLSIPSDSPIYEIGEFDKVAALNRTDPFNIKLVSGVNNYIKYRVIEITQITWLDSNKDIVFGDLPYIDIDGRVQWSGNAPPLDTTYSVTGTRIPEYYVYLKLPFDRPHHSGRKLPRRVVLRPFDLFNSN